MDPFSGAATAACFVYIILSTQGNKLCFVFAIIGSAFWAYADLFIYNLKFDALLQAFYIYMAVIGWYKWKSVESEDEFGTSSYPIKVHALIVLSALIASYIISNILTEFTSTSFAFLDALTTVLSVFATFMMINKKVENWLYLGVSDIIYIYIYSQQGATLFMLIMILYVFMAYIGYFRWKSYYLEKI